MTTLLIIICATAFVGVAALVGAIGFYLRDRDKTLEHRLDAFTSQRAVAAGESESVEIWKEAAFDADKKTLLDQLTPKLPSFEKVFQQADCHIKPSSLIGMAVLLATLGGTASWILGVKWYLIPLPATVLFFVPIMWLLNKRRRRLKKFGSQLPDALELLARALRAGQSLASALHVVAEECPSPIAEEFGRVYEEQNLGIGVEDALRSMCERVPNLDLRFFVTSVAIQRQTGGDLAEILDKIGYVIRERFRIMGQVMALTGEGRLSGVVLIILPFVLFVTVLHMSPDYVELLWTTDTGIKMTVVALIMQVLGAIVIKKIVNIKV